MRIGPAGQGLWITLAALCAAAWPSGCFDPGTGGSALNVVEREDLGAVGKCENSALCIADYQRFIQLAQAHASPTTQAELNAQLTDIDAGNVDLVPPPVPADMLRDVIIDKLNLRFLLSGLDRQLLEVTTIQRNELEDHDETLLLFQDPWVGEFEGILLTPKGQGPFSAIVAVHGHGDSAAVFRDTYFGAEYPSRGYAILMLTMRAMGGGSAFQDEHDITLELIESGFDLIALRVYESLLGFKYLRYLPIIEADRIGLIGHSGGSSTGNLTVRLESRLGAYVSDHDVDYAEWVNEFAEFDIYYYHCETAPQLYPYNALIRDLATSTTPVLDVPYAYTDGMDEIFALFDQHI